ncbi:cytochrome P460 family protein [Paenibacillus sp.]|uniref:cytochrome P460 family protein n=1 Tax=Paenibacillus sp. TaxID=58172 RepID=UPI002D22ACAF|nr:cytochrome P460 family protein [Paenibacillus sp.]HZG85531.1 cytochrome P460 family protein [Paenibacillus sp.]
MKKQIISALLLLLSLTLAACNSNYDTNDMSQQEPSGNTPQQDASADTSQQDASGDTSQQEPSEPSGYDRELVKFPENYDKGVNYATVTRGNIREEAYTSREAIEAVQNGQPIPSGTVIVLEIYEDEELFDIFVMEKRTGWGDQKPPEDPRNGDWLFQEFNADKSLGYDVIGRCFSCHANQERDDHVYTLDEMKSYELEDVTGSKDSSTESRFAGIPTEDWEVNVISPHNEKSRLIGNEGKAGIIANVLLTMYLQQNINQ